jgi:hypothetical protein
MTQPRIIPTDGFMRQQDNPGAIVNVDKKSLNAYKLKREREKQEETDINKLREEMSDIKDLLKQLLEKNSK